MPLERLQKIIAASGLLSRRKAEEAITSGRVFVNGAAVTELGSKADPETDEIRVDGKLLARDHDRTIIALHKPRRVVTTKQDPQGRKTVMDLLPSDLQTLKPVGRLDYDSEGLLILTNDGELANRLAHPRYGVRKTYQVWVEGTPTAETLSRFRNPIELEDGPGRFESVRSIPAPPRTPTPPAHECAFEVVVSEGRNRFVRRMWAALGHPVLRLKRVRIGALELGDLAAGKYRFLSEDDLRLLDPDLLASTNQK